jgi:hypothetical protein
MGRTSRLSRPVCDTGNICHSVRYITIKNEKAVDDCPKSFPNATELTLDFYRCVHSTLFTTDALRHVISITHLQKLIIRSYHLTFNEIVDVLLYIPNIHTLGIPGIKTTAKEISTLQKSEKFRLVSEQNQIKNVIISNYSLITVKMFVELCPKLQHLSSGTSQKSFIEIVRYLLSKNSRKYSGISSFSLRIFPLNKKLIKKVKTLVQSKKHIGDYSLKVLENEFYLWWS